MRVFTVRKKTFSQNLLSLVCIIGLVALSSQPVSAQSGTKWIGAWSTAPTGNSGQQVPDFADATFRQIIHTNFSGNVVRIRFTNEFGVEPLKIEKAEIAVSKGGSEIDAATKRKITFHGRSSISIPAGSVVLSDEITLPVSAFADLAISFFLPAQQISTSTFHGFAGETNYLRKGDAVSEASWKGATEVKSWYFVNGIEVAASVTNPAAIVTLGDSITDGVGSTMNTNSRWPDVLAKRLHHTKLGNSFTVLNEGIGGNRLLRDGAGPSALSRYDRDVLAQANVKYVIVLEGINDIGRLARNNDPADQVDAADLEFALQQIAVRAHNNGVRVIAATITPYHGAGYFTEKGEAVRSQVNDWIRNSKTFDGVADFDKALRDPVRPDSLLPQYDCGDHLHPNDAGYKAMGETINLDFFGVKVGQEDQGD